MIEKEEEEIDFKVGNIVEITGDTEEMSHPFAACTHVCILNIDEEEELAHAVDITDDEEIYWVSLKDIRKITKKKPKFKTDDMVKIHANDYHNHEEGAIGIIQGRCREFVTCISYNVAVGVYKQIVNEEDLEPYTKPTYKYFKVGDRVRVRKDIKEGDPCLNAKGERKDFVVKNMLQYAGETTRIKEVAALGLCVNQLERI